MGKLAAIALLFLAGVLLRRIGWLDAGHATRMLRLVATFGLPALIIGTVGRMPIEPVLLALPASAAAVMLTVIYDAGNAVTQWTVVYLLAVRFGGHAADARKVLSRLASAVPALLVFLAF